MKRAELEITKTVFNMKSIHKKNVFVHLIIYQRKSLGFLYFQLFWQIFLKTYGVFF